LRKTQPDRLLVVGGDERREIDQIVGQRRQARHDLVDR